MVTGHNSENVLELRGVKATYKLHTVVSGREVYVELEVVHGINMTVRKGEIVAILGANGAGKSTLMWAIVGILEKQPINGRVTGEIIFDEHVINRWSPEKITGAGITLVPEGRYLFPLLTVRENLDVGTYAVKNKLDKKARKRNMDTVFRLFPRLEERQNQFCDRLSGGEAQMVAIARGFVSQPKLLLLDEPCLGLAPALVKELMATLSRLRNEFGMTILMAEQNTSAALSIADRGYVLRTGEIVDEATASDLAASDSIRMAYLGIKKA